MDHMQKIMQHTLSALDEPPVTPRRRGVPVFDFELGVHIRDRDGRIGVVVTDFEPVRPGRYSGPPENCYPDEGGHCDFELYHAEKGYRLKHIEKHLPADVEDDIVGTIFAQHERAIDEARAHSRARALGWDY